MKLARGALRVLYRRKLDTLSLIALVALVVFIYGALSLSVYNVKEHVYVQVRSELGDVAIASTFSGEKASLIAEKAGASMYRLYLVAFAKMEAGGENVSVVLIGAPYFDEAVKVKALSGGEPRGPGEAAYYRVISGGGFEVPDVPPGSTVRVYAYAYNGSLLVFDLAVTGVYRGFSWIAGSPYALVVDESVVRTVTGGVYYLAAFWAGSVEGDEIDRLEDSLLRALEEEGMQAYWVFKNKKEENPIVNLLESAANIIFIPTSLVVLLSALIPAAAGSISVFRDLRVIATLKSMGASWPELFTYYTLPWLARGAAGSIIAVAMLLAWADDFYFALFVGDSEIAAIMRDSLGFSYNTGLLLEATGTAFTLVAAGGLVPLLLASRVNSARVLRMSELPTISEPPRARLRGPLMMRSSIRDVASRRWKLAGLILSLGILWGMAVSMEMEGRSIDEIREFYEEEIPADAFISVASLAPLPPEPVWATVRAELSGDPSVSSYTLFHSERVIGGLVARGQPIALEFIYVLDGDPSTAFPLAGGRYPQGPGEALTSESMARYLGISLGDKVSAVTPQGEKLDLTIVGVSGSRVNNGFYLLVADDGPFKEEPGYYSVVAYMDFAEGVGEDYLLRVKDRLEAHGYLSVPIQLTRSDIVEGIGTLGAFLKAIFSGLITVSSIAAGIVVSTMVLVDASTRARELASLHAIGASRRAIIAGYLLQLLVALALASPIAFVAGYALAKITAARSALALGYLDPQPGLGAL
nr:hypothetical protein [Desulfurococcales archaeon]